MVLEFCQPPQVWISRYVLTLCGVCLHSFSLQIDLLYFGTKFIREEINIPSYHYRQFISTAVANRYLSSEMKEFMEADLQLYEEIFKPNKKGKSGFFELKGMKFVYESGFHTAFRRVKPSDLNSWGFRMKEETPMVMLDPCIDPGHGCRDIFLPYLFENYTLLSKYRAIDEEEGERKERNKQRYEELQAIMNGEKDHLHTCFHCVGHPFETKYYDENDWTERLFYSIKEELPVNTKVRITYHLGQSFKKLQQIYSLSQVTGCYVFTGAPDMIFTVKESSILFSEREFNIVELKEDKLTMPRDNEWSELLPNEAGQTIAAIQFMAVAKVINSIMTNDQIPTSVKCRGKTQEDNAVYTRARYRESIWSRFNPCEVLVHASNR